MTEAEWENSDDPVYIEYILWAAGRLTERKGRLFAVACCRSLWSLLTDGRSRRAVEVSERYADGLASRAELEEANRLAHEHTWECDSWHSCVVANVAKETSSLEQRIDFVASDAARAKTWKDDPGTEEEARKNAMYVAELCQQAQLVREIFGNPLRLPPSVTPLLPRWNGGLIPRLAEAAYNERLLPDGILDPARLAVLSDALDEAEADAELIRHLRSPGPHVRGCHAVDAILGKA
jgi:hypothetical protein